MTELSPVHMAVHSTRRMPRDVASSPVPFDISSISESGERRVFRLAHSKCLIGSASNVDLTLEDETVSAQHLEIELIPEGVRVRDLGSRGGTYYRGQQVTHLTLSAEATLRVGRTDLHLSLDTESLRGSAGRESYAQLTSRSSKMQQLFGVLRRIEGSLLNVLIFGEPGTGKELIARAIHDHSAVSEGPVISMNCNSLSREQHSELFDGAFRDADGGTLFLDNVGELPFELQPLLLRVLQQGEVPRLGEIAAQQVNARVIAATHRNLEEMVKRGEFHEELYRRLNLIRIGVPPLRECPQDIELLARLAAERAGASDLPESVLSQLQNHVWPGNVRELMHAVEVYLAMGELPRLQRQKPHALDQVLAEHIDVNVPYDTLKRLLTDRFLAAYLQQLLTHTRGNVSQAARISGLERSYLNKLVIQFGLR